jgi:hypothetical protein
MFKNIWLLRFFEPRRETLIHDKTQMLYLAVVGKLKISHYLFSTIAVDVERVD